jgi:hypothetical protein
MLLLSQQETRHALRGLILLEEFYQVNVALPSYFNSIKYIFIRGNGCDPIMLQGILEDDLQHQNPLLMDILIR